MNTQDILSKANHRSGMTVPEGYFADVNRRMTASLPKQPWETECNTIPRSFWQKVRPYVYMAAMFMGVWCMMKMFDLMKPTDNISISDNPTIMAAIDNDAFFNDYIAVLITEDQVLNELYDDDFDTEDFDMTH